MQKIPEKSIERIFIYLRILEDFSGKVISSQELSVLAGFSPDVIRKDLSFLGRFGTPGKGYYTEDLRQVFKNTLKREKIRILALVGVGNLGRALILYKGFSKRGFIIKFAFDNDKNKVGRKVGSLVIRDVKDMPHILQKNKVDIGVVCTPKDFALQTIELLAKCGVKYILNFAPIKPRLPGRVFVYNVDLSLELERLSFKIKD